MTPEINKERAEELSPSDELKYATDGMVNGDWGEVEDCLHSFARKVQASGISAEARGLLREEFNILKSRIGVASIPEDYNTRILNALTSADESL
ncbi:MAG: hypothetical protein WC465_04375 [Patescibacteria group bacterium]